MESLVAPGGIPATARPAFRKEGTTMLVLTRRVEETIVIDGSIRITVVAVAGDKVRLAIDAPARVRVDREEVHARRAAAGSAPAEMEMAGL